ncbi:Sentrin-specific protease 7 [Schistosoma japonicum]|uniref:Putative Sentrin-specific protease 7 n=2 Tax=Schistosoma japonicum TaxID=6182 RepID=C7TXQ8_SCHJA|nr:Sentrin-specific protease 7 [Schistosoma japonicum]CAX82384.1 putative Sentrin-specific protease 7 [Schistosoma japonicum]
MMLREVQDALRRKSPNIHEEKNKRFWKCPQPNCHGFACPTDFRCTMCSKIIDFSDTSHKSSTKTDTITSSSNGTPSVKRSKIINNTHLVPLNIFSIGRSGIFDGRAEDCCITSSSISCKVKVEGVWTSVIIQSNNMEVLVFCETLQVVFVKPSSSFKSQLSESLKIKEFILPSIKWLILVFRESSTSDLYLTVNDLEGLANKVRENGSCDMHCSAEKAREILSSCGLRLPRAESKRTHSTSCESQNCNQVDQAQFKSDSNSISNLESSSSQTGKHASEGGLLTNVINTLTHSGVNLTSNSSSFLKESEHTVKGKLIANDSEKECDDLIILSEETTGEWIQNAKSSALANSSNPPTGSFTNSDEDSLKFDYKPPGSTDSITLTNNDIECLAPGALLNDTIINFYLKYLYFEQLTDFQKQATYLFNVFFYSRLASGGNLSGDTRGSTVSPNLSKAIETTDEMIYAQHANVAKWTRRVDLFSKDYIIIPINECAHWFLGLVCYPWMAGMVSYTALYREEVYHLCQLTEKFTDVDRIKFSGDLDSLNIGEEVIQRLPTDAPGEAFDRWRRRRLSWLRQRGVNAMPCVLLFDSLPCQSRVSNLHVIRNYLQVEWNTRRSVQDGVLRFDKDTIRGFSPRVPVQSNLVDCGIYLLHYVEMFFKKPVQSYTKDYFQHEMAGWFPEATVSQKRAQIHDLLVSLRDRTLREKTTNP